MASMEEITEAPSPTLLVSAHGIRHHAKDFPKSSDDSASIQKAGDSPFRTTTPAAHRKSSMSGLLFDRADGLDFVVLSGGLFIAMLNGVMGPGLLVLLGESINAAAHPDVHAQYAMLLAVAKKMAVLGAINFITGALCQGACLWTSARLTAQMRIKYFEGVLSRDIAWFDREEPAAMPTRIAVEAQAVQDAINSLGLFTTNASQFVVGLVSAFIKGWQLALVIFASLPILAIFGVYAARSVNKFMSDQQEWFNKAGAVAEEILLAMRTVAAFGAECREAARFESQLSMARYGGIKAGMHVGFSWGIVILIFLMTYALAFWYGAYHLVAKGKSTAADVVVVFVLVALSLTALQNMSFFSLGFSRAAVAIRNMRAVLEAEPEIEPMETERNTRQQLETLELGTIERIEFRDVRFSYPSRPGVPVLQGLNLTLLQGQKIAFVGESGSGKSTILALLERFYDPCEGELRVNGIPLCELPVHAWRRRIGFVGQEPVLFATSVMENIRSGDTSITESQLVEAARHAHIYDFLLTLPDEFNTYVGVSGNLISTGQKQRIAIARALARKPQILLLDEATSALDNESEKQVQATLEVVQGLQDPGFMTISVAHRLSTVRNSDVIFVLSSGAVLEQGSHEELMEKQGVYTKLVQSQAFMKAEGSEEVSGRFAQVSASSDQAGLARSPSQTSVLSVISIAVSETLGLHTERKESEKEEATHALPKGRLLRLSRPEWIFYPPAFLAAVISGSVWPMTGCMMVGGIVSLTQTPTEAMLEDVDLWCLGLVGLGVIATVFVFAKYAVFTHIQETLAMRLRVQAFSSILRQEIGFFDDPRNSTTGLAAALARQAVQVSTMTGISLGNTIEAVSSIAMGILLGLLASWKLGLALLAMMPVVAIAVLIPMILTSKETHNEAHIVASKVATEAVLSIRTLRALQTEQQHAHRYAEEITRACSHETAHAWKKALALSFGQNMVYIILIVDLSYGGRLMASSDLDAQGLYRALFCMMLGLSGASFIAPLIQDALKGRVAVREVFRLMDRKSKVDAMEPKGKHKDLGDGSVEFEDVAFKYPTRPERSVLCKLNFRVSCGQSVAFVGPSGSGKTTVLQLLQRFYDPCEGIIMVGGEDLLLFDVAWWRQQLGYVGQEPILFNSSLEDNVRYGNMTATHAEVEAAAQEANMDYAFNGQIAWEDTVGVGGVELSGGQKQRCAIARAILRRPAVLLLDEATSSLDSASEHLVHQALVAMRRGRTTFIVAHRLSTIADADQIFVLESGTILQRGTHQELMSAEEGLYARLAKHATERAANSLADGA